MIIVNRVLGHCDDAFWVEVCESLEKEGRLEILNLAPHHVQHGQYRARTDKGTVVGVRFAEPESDGALRPGSIVFYEEGSRIVLLRIQDARVLVIAPLNNFTESDAVTLGHYLGAHGWRIYLGRRQAHLEIFVHCQGDELMMDEVLRRCPVVNIAWTFRDRKADDPVCEPDNTRFRN